jgi:hypothetical protein
MGPHASSHYRVTAVTVVHTAVWCALGTACLNPRELRTSETSVYFNETIYTTLHPWDWHIYRQTDMLRYRQTDSESSGSHGGEYEDHSLPVHGAITLVELDRRFRGAHCVYHQGDDWWWNCTQLWNVALILRDYTLPCTRRPLYSDK